MRNVSLDAWKIIAALVIVTLHIGNVNIGGEFPFRGGYIYVEFFFMVSGYYLIRGLENGKIDDGIAYTKKKILHIFPYTTVLIIAYYTYLISGMKGNTETIKTLLMRLPLELTLLSHFELTDTSVGILWYIAYMLLVTPIICVLFKKYKEAFNVLLYGAPIFWWGYCMHKYGYLLGIQEVFFFRAFVGMLLGGCVYYVAQYLSKNKPCHILKLVFSAVAWFFFGVTIWLSYKYHNSIYDLYIVCYFFIALVLQQSGWTYDIRGNCFNVLGDLSMTIYITHVFAIMVVVKFWGDMSLKQRYILSYGITFLFAVLLMFIGKKIENYISKRSQIS